MNLEITALYAALLGVLFIFLSLMVSKNRLRAHVSLGDGGDEGLVQTIRAQGNFAEYVPMALLLLGLVEVQGAAAGLVHGLGAALLLGRLMHAWGITQPKAVNAGRKFGTILTWLMILAASVYLLFAVLA
jgi:uncharacterized membrane protein YecN with MAPEG domain